MKKPKIKKTIPRQNRPQKLRVKYLLKRNGTKNKREAGTPTNILFAKIIVCVLFWCSMYENANCDLISKNTFDEYHIYNI